MAEEKRFELLEGLHPRRFSNSRANGASKALESSQNSRNGWNGASSRAAAIVTDSDKSERMTALVFSGRTQWDETKTATVDPVEAALALALERATDDATIAAIVAELAARRARR